MKVISVVCLFFVLNSCVSQIDEINRPDSSDIVLDEKEVDTSICDRVIVMSCIDSSLIFSNEFTMPDSCLKVFQETKGEVEYKTRISVFKECVQESFRNPMNNFVCDTIYVSREDVIMREHGQSQEEVHLVNKLEVINNEEHYLVKRYTLKELEGVCISGEYRTKSRESWRFGTKHGVWKYFYKTGQLKHLIEYENGVMIREEKY